MVSISGAESASPSKGLRKAREKEGSANNEQGNEQGA